MRFYETMSMWIRYLRKSEHTSSPLVEFNDGVPMAVGSRTVPSQPTLVFQSSTGEAEIEAVAMNSEMKRVENCIVRES